MCLDGWLALKALLFRHSVLPAVFGLVGMCFWLPLTHTTHPWCPTLPVLFLMPLPLPDVWNWLCSVWKTKSQTGDLCITSLIPWSSNHTVNEEITPATGWPGTRSRIIGVAGTDGKVKRVWKRRRRFQCCSSLKCIKLLFTPLTTFHRSSRIKVVLLTFVKMHLKRIKT